MLLLRPYDYYMNASPKITRKPKIKIKSMEIASIGPLPTRIKISPSISVHANDYVPGTIHGSNWIDMRIKRAENHVIPD